MASNKRQRKKTNQAARRAALEAARKRQQRNRKLRNLAGLVFGVLLLAALIAFFASRGDDSETASPPTTTTTPGKDTPCPKPTGEPRTLKFEKAPPMCIDPAKTYRAVFTTSAGVVKANLDTKRTPMTTNNFVVLARYGYYSATSFHRTEPSIDIIQGGSPNTNTAADPGPGYTIQDEGGKFTYTEGDLVMARSSGPNSASAQYFFSVGPNTKGLDAQGTYVTFGKVTEGLDVLKKVLATHTPCPTPPPPGCNGGSPQPPVTVESVAIEEA